MHDDDVQLNGNTNKRSDNVIEFKSRRTKETEKTNMGFLFTGELAFSLDVYESTEEGKGYEFNVQLPEDNELNDLDVAEILARAAFQIAPEEFSEQNAWSQEVVFEPEIGNDGWIDDDEELLSYVMKGNKELTDD